MRKKFQEGGLAAATQREDPSSALFSLFGQFNQSTPEAQRFAREYLEDYRSYDFSTEEELLDQFRETAEQSRQALREAREKVLTEEYDPRQKWLAAAQAFGAPTRTGQFGETIGQVAGAIREPFAEEQEFESDQRNELLALDQALSGVDENLLMNEFKLQQLRREQAGDLAKESLRQLGRQSQTPSGPISPKDIPGLKSLDQKIATEYTDWVTGGATNLQAKMATLGYAIDNLANTDNISGPWIGMIPKMGRDVLIPESANTQEVIETVAQESLKAILGGQFGQREGEMLLERTFNPRLEEADNRRRAQALLLKIQRAFQEKQRAMQWFQDHQTMYGYDGKSEWTLEDFMPEETMRKVRMEDGEVIEVPDTWKAPRIRQFYENEYVRPQQHARGGRIKRRRGGRLRKKFQGGGPVDIEDLDEIAEIDELEDGFLPEDLLSVTGGAAVGTGVGLGAEEALTRIEENMRGVHRPPRSEQLVGVAMEKSGVEPAAAVTEVKRGQRAGVPERLVDQSGRVTQRLNERAMVSAGDIGDIALATMEDRLAGSRQRVGRQVERGLRTPEFFDTEQRMTERLYTRASPIYKQAYAENTGVKMPPFWKEMFENRFGRQAVEHALDFMELKGKPIGAQDVTGMVQKPSLEFLDEVKRGFDQMIRKEEAQGSTPLGRLLRQQRNRLVKFLDNPKNVTPTYAKARAQYKGDLEVLEALDIGRREFHRLPPQEARNMFNDMSATERMALKTGVAQHIYEMIYNPSGNVDAARRLMGSEAMRRRLQILFERPREWRVFEAALTREMDMLARDKRTTRTVERGRTGRMMGEVMAMDDPLASVKGMISRGPIMWALRTIGWGRRSGGISEQQADEIVDILMTKDLSELENITPQIEYAREYAHKRRKRRGRAAAVGAGIGAAITAGVRFGSEDEPEELDDTSYEAFQEALGVEEEDEE